MGNTTNPHERDGKGIATRPDQIKRIDDNFYQVRSQSLSKESWYDVIRTEKGLVCDCPDYQWRNRKCKHVFAVEFSQRIRKQVESLIISRVEASQCKFCNSTNIIKKGIRKNMTYNLQVFKCRDCNKRFSINLGFERMKASPQIITSAMQLYFTGESLRNVQKFLELQGVKITHKTVWNWIRKYTGLMESYLEKVTPHVGDVWRADELFIKVKGNMKYLYAMMDDETRFWIAKQVSDNKMKDDVSQMLVDGKELTGKKPSVFITDGARNFHQAYKREFWSHTVPRTDHIRHIHFKNDMNNNRMERLNNEIRDREKVMRSLKRQDTPIIEGYRIYHNYFRPHMALNGQTPAEASGIKIEGDNKWITLIQNARKNQGL